MVQKSETQRTRGKGWLQTAADAEGGRKAEADSIRSKHARGNMCGRCSGYTGVDVTQAIDNMHILEAKEGQNRSEASA